MTRYENQTFNKKTLVVDGNRYISCTFVDCGLVFRGGDLPSFNRCTFTRTQIQLEGAARTTLNYLTVLNGQGLFTNVNGVIANVKKGTLPVSTRPESCDGQATGTNYAALLGVIGVFAAIFLLIGVGIWWGFIYHPEENLLAQTQPLYVEIPLDVMPALPENLALAYDDHLEGQSDILQTYGWVDDEESIAHIPIDEAMNMMLEDGLPNWQASGG